MIAFIALFFPAALATYIFCRSKQDPLYYLAVYIAAVIIVNCIDVMVMVFIFNNNDNFIGKLNQYNDFILKYIGLSMLISVVTPLGIKWIRERIHISINVSSIGIPISLKRILTGSYVGILFAINFIRIFDNNFWGDEAYSINIVKNSIPVIINAQANSSHPPLYFIILRIAYLLFGDHGYVYHAVSLIPLVIIIAVSLTTVNKLFGKGTSILLITMATLSPNAVVYNVEVRMYSLAAAFILLSYCELYKVLKRNGESSSLFRFALFSLGAAYTHYYAFISVAFFYVILLIWSFVQEKKTFMKVLVTSCGTIVAYLPWFCILLKAFARNSKGFWITSAPTFRQCLVYLFSDQFNKIAYVLLAVAFIFAMLYELQIFEIGKLKEKEIALSFDTDKFCLSDDAVWILTGVLSILGTIAVGICVSTVFRPLFVLRYIYPVSIIAWLLMGVIVSKLKLNQIYIAILWVYMLFAFIPAYQLKYVQEKGSNDKLKITLDKTSDGISGTSIIMTDIEHINWTIAKCYYPEAKCQLLRENQVPKLETNSDYWMFLSGEMNDQYTDGLRSQGYSYEIIVDNGVLGTHRVTVYHLTRIPMRN